MRLSMTMDALCEISKPTLAESEQRELECANIVSVLRS